MPLECRVHLIHGERLDFGLEIGFVLVALRLRGLERDELLSALADVEASRTEVR